MKSDLISSRHVPASTTNVLLDAKSPPSRASCLCLPGASRSLSVCPKPFKCSVLRNLLSRPNPSPLPYRQPLVSPRNLVFESEVSVSQLKSLPSAPGSPSNERVDFKFIRSSLCVCVPFWHNIEARKNGAPSLFLVLVSSSLHISQSVCSFDTPATFRRALPLFFSSLLELYRPKLSNAISCLLSPQTNPTFSFLSRISTSLNAPLLFNLQAPPPCCCIHGSILSIHGFSVVRLFSSLFHFSHDHH